MQLLPRGMEVRSGLLRGRASRGESVLSYWNCEFLLSAPHMYGRLILTRSSFPARKNLYNNLTYLYPESTIWMTGHSLGGALASLLGVTFGTPTVAIESPGEKMASRRLHLPSPVRPPYSLATLLPHPSAYPA